MIDDGYIKDGLVFAMVGGLLVDVAKNNTITNNGTTLTTDHNGRANRGWSFVTSESDYMSLNTLAALSIANNFTVQIGFKLNDTASIQVLLSHRIASNDQVHVIQQNHSIRVGYYNGSETVSKSISNTTSSNYKFLDFKLNGGTVEAALDGAILVGTDSLAGNSPTDGFNIGRRTDIRYYLNGDIDSFLIYNRVLSSNETQYNYNYWLSH